MTTLVGIVALIGWIRVSRLNSIVNQRLATYSAVQMNDAG